MGRRRSSIPAELVFLLSSAAVVAAGVRLSRDGDSIADITGLGAAWVGAILVAAATSLPELVTDVYAVRAGDISLAMGDLFGSSMANMVILAGADLATYRHRILNRVAVNQTLVGMIAISITAIIAAGIVANDDLSIFNVGWAPILALAVYIGGMRLLHLNRQHPPFETTTESASKVEAPTSSLRIAAIGFAVSAGVIVFAARFLAQSSADLADKYDISQGFVGVALLAVTTSLPELSVTISAVSRGSYDLAVGNLLGSNCFNMAIPFVLDIVYRDGSILNDVEPAVTTGGMFAILLTAMTLMEIMHKSERRIWLIEPDALARILVYFLGLVLIFRAGG